MPQIINEIITLNKINKILIKINKRKGILGCEVRTEEVGRVKVKVIKARSRIC